MSKPILNKMNTKKNNRLHYLKQTDFIEAFANKILCTNNKKIDIINSILFYAGVAILLCVITGTWWLTFSKQENPIYHDRDYDSIRKAQQGFIVDPLVTIEGDYQKKVLDKSSLLLKPLLYIINPEQTVLVLLLICTIIICFSVKYWNNAGPSLFLILAALAPAVITTLTSYSDYTLAITFACISIALLFSKKIILAILGIIITAYFNIVFGLGLLFILGYWIYKNKAPLYSGLLAVPISIGVISLTTKSITPLHYSFQTILSDLGAIYGISSLLFVLGGIGFIIHCKKNPEHIILALGIIALCFLDLRGGLLLSSLTLIYYASILLEKIIYQTWESDILKTISIFSIILTFLFSSLSHIQLITSSSTPVHVDETLLWMNRHTLENATVLSHSDYGYAIKWFANRKVVLDTEMEHEKAAQKRLKDIDILFNTRNHDTAVQLLDQYAIRYILVSEEMRNSLIWSRKDVGLQFLLENDDSFRLIYHKDNTDIYYYAKKQAIQNTTNPIILKKQVLNEI